MQHRPHRRLRGARRFALAALPLAVLQAHAAQLTAVWTNPSSGSYGTASNWNGAHVPLNDATNTYIAQISGVAAVGYGVLETNAVDQLLLDSGVGFNLTGSSFITPTALTVLGRALIGGTIGADNASFTALGAGTAFAGTRNAVSAVNGAVVAIGGSAFNASGYQGATILNAQNDGSRIDLAGVALLNVGGGASGNGYDNSVTANDKARIGLSGLKQVIAPGRNNGNLVFNANGGGAIDLSALNAVQGVTLDSGSTYFNSDGGSFALGAMQSANRVFVTLKNGAAMTVAGSTNTAQITNSWFSASAGAQLRAAGWKAEYHVYGNRGDLLAATNAGSLLDLSGVSLLDSGGPAGGNGYDNKVTATDKAKIDLSGLKQVIAPGYNSGNLVFTANGGAAIDLSALNAVQGVTLDSGSTYFNSDAGSFALGAMQSANRTFVNLNNGAVMTVAGSANTAQITNSSFSASAGAQLRAAGWKAEFHVYGNRGDLLTATNSGSLLDLSGMSLLDSGGPAGGNGYNNNVAATDKAKIDLSGLKRIIAPGYNSGSLVFTANGGAALDLSALNAVQGVTLDSGSTDFNSDGGRLTLGPMQSANRMFVTLRNGAAMTIAGSGSTAQVTSSTFDVASGAQLQAGGWKAEYHVVGNRGTVLAAANAGTVLNLGGVTLLDSSGPASGNGYSNNVNASDLAVIDLSAMTRVIAPGYASAALNFNASGGAAIKLSSLQVLGNPGGGQVNFNVASGATITLHGLAAGPAVHFNLTDAGSTLSFLGGLSLLNGSTMAAGTGTHVDLRGSFAFAQTTESQMNLDQAVVSFLGKPAATLEIGGASLGLPSLGSVVRNNFAIGQLVLGQTGTAALVELADAIDNGNRHSPEVLYLNGVGGSNGLRLYGGSTLVLDGYNVYALDNGRWTHLNDLFVKGATRISYDQGFLALDVVAAAVPEPATWALWVGGFGMLTLLARRRLP